MLRHYTLYSLPFLTARGFTLAMLFSAALLAGGRAQALILSNELEAVVITDVTDAWRVIDLEHSFDVTHGHPIVACTYRLPSDAARPALVRLRNIDADSFEIRLQTPEINTGDDDTGVQASDVHCLIAEQNPFDQPSAVHKLTFSDSSEITFKALSVTSGTTNTQNNWTTAAATDLSSQVNSIDFPATSVGNPAVVLGQVMSYSDTDPRYSAFWTYGCASRTNGPTLLPTPAICVGKQIGKVQSPPAAISREIETLGVIIIESGAGVIDGMSIDVGLAENFAAPGDTTFVRGVGNAPPYRSLFPNALTANSEASLAVTTMQGMRGGQGGWSVLYGDEIFPVGGLNLAIEEEDLAGNPDRSHTNEKVAYFAMEAHDRGDAAGYHVGENLHHHIDLDKNQWLGPIRPDGEGTGILNAEATCDDATGLAACPGNVGPTDDEGGVVFAVASEGVITATVNATNSDDKRDAYVCIWLDIGADGTGNGSFDESDKGDGNADGDNDPDTGDRCITFPSAVDKDTPTLLVDQVFTWLTPTDFNSAQDIYARIRICDRPNECDKPSGHAKSGEVEDYRFSIDPTVVRVGDVTLESVSVDTYMASLELNNMEPQAARLWMKNWLSANDVEAPSNATEEDLLGSIRQAIDPNNDNRLALLVWETLEEIGTIGFFVERKSGAGGWIRIHHGMLSGLITAPLGGQYMLIDPHATPGTQYLYRLIEQEARGSQNTYGPFILQY